jgi:dTDP-glucose 4,6-dehydratase
MRVNDGRAIPNFIKQALRGEDLTVFGDGSQTRSVCYVSDLIDGIFKLMMSDYEFPMNIGNPDELTMLKLAEDIVQLTHSKSKIVFEALPTDDPRVRQPNIAKARETLGWEPKVNRAEGFARTIEYFRKKLKIF